MREREYQDKVKGELERIYTGEEVVAQWYPFKGEVHGARMYSPAVDVAVGPFATERRYEIRYAELLENTRGFVEHLIEKHNQNVEHEERTSFGAIAYFNENARCLLCIEIEASGTPKHCLGNLVNASALGRIGLLVACSPEFLKVFVRQRVYLRYLADLRKNTFKTNNALVLTTEQFDECLAGTLSTDTPK
jgi:hypothetical protein